MEPETERMIAIDTPNAPRPRGGYSQAVIAGGFVFVAGQRPADPATGDMPGGIEAQTEVVLSNVAAILEAAGASLRDVVKVTVHLQQLEADFAGFDGVYREHFSDPLPVRTTVGSHLRDFLVEVDVIALAPA